MRKIKELRRLFTILLFLIICIVFETGISAKESDFSVIDIPVIESESSETDIPAIESESTPSAAKDIKSKVRYKYVRIINNQSITVSTNSFKGKITITCTNKKKVTIKKSRNTVKIIANRPGLVVVTLRDKTRIVKYCIYIYKNKAEKKILNNLFLKKRISVLGDSLSSHEDLHVGNYRYYNSQGKQQKKIRMDMRDQYWALIKDLFNMQMGVNYSIAGSMISGYHKSDAMASKTKINQLDKNGNPNVILYYGGTNDQLSGKQLGIPLGRFNPKSTYVRDPLSSIKNQNTYPDFVSGYVVSLRRMMHRYPKAVIIALIPSASEKSHYWTEMIKVCEFYNIQYVKLSNADITSKDMADSIHVNQKGYLKIANCILKELGKQKKLLGS